MTNIYLLKIFSHLGYQCLSREFLIVLKLVVNQISFYIFIYVIFYVQNDQDMKSSLLYFEHYANHKYTTYTDCILKFNYFISLVVKMFETNYNNMNVFLNNLFS